MSTESKLDVQRYIVFRQTKTDSEPRQVFATSDLKAARAHATRLSNQTNWVYVYDSEAQ